MSPAELASSGTVFGTSYLRTLAGKESVIGTDDAVGTAASFSMPVSVVFDEAPCATCNESSIYVSDLGSHSIRAVGSVSARVTTLAGGKLGYRDGSGRVAEFNRPIAVAIDSARRRLFVADQGNRRIRLVVLPATDDGSAVVSTLAGSGEQGQSDGVPLQAKFLALFALCMDPTGLRLYISDLYAVRVLNLLDKDSLAASVETLAGSSQKGIVDGQRMDARFGLIRGLAMESDGSLLYVADTDNGRIRAVRVSSGEVTTYAGSVVGTKDGMRLAGFGSLSPVTASAASRIPAPKCTGSVALTLPTGWISDGDASYDAGQSCEWVIRAAENQIVTLQFSSFETETGFDTVTVLDAANQQVAILSGSLYQGASVTAIGGMRIRFETDMSVQGAGFTGRYSIGYSQARTVSAEVMQTADLAAALLQPVGLSRLGRKLYFTESTSSQLRFVDVDTGRVSTLVASTFGAGARDGPISSTSSYVSLHEPVGLSGSSKGVLYVADSFNRLIRELKLAPSQFSAANTTLFGYGANAIREPEEADASQNIDYSPTKLPWIAGGVCGALFAAAMVAALVAVFKASKKRSRIHTIMIVAPTGSQVVPMPQFS